MSIDLKVHLQSLKKYIVEVPRPKEAEKCVEIIVEFFGAELSNSEIDLGIDTLLGEKDGSINLITTSLKHDKLFKQVNISLFELYLTLIEKHSKKFVPYSKSLTQCGTVILSHPNVSAKEKELAVKILKEMIEKQIFPEGEVEGCLKTLFQILKMQKQPERFLQGVYQLIGLISREYPHVIGIKGALHFREEMINILENVTIKKNKFSFLTISGAVDALNDHFVNYPPSKSDEIIIIKRVYNIIKSFSAPAELNDKSIFRSSLSLFKNHCHLFGEEILKDYLYWHKIFNDWFKLGKADDKKFTVPSVYAFHLQIAETILENDFQNVEESVKVLQFFLNYFKDLLRDSLSRPFEIRLAIRGFGILAAPCKIFLPKNTVNELANLVIASTNYAYFSELADKRDKIEHLPDFIQALSEIMGQITEFSVTQLASLENIILGLIQDFHFLGSYHHAMVIRSLITTFYNCSLLGGTVMEDLLSKVIHQGVIWTCSHKLIYDTYQDDQDWKENITYKNYLPLWIGMLKGLDIASFDHSLVRNAVLDKFLESLLIITSKLDLKLTKRIFVDEMGNENEFHFCDPNTDLIPLKPIDFQIFVNLVSFYQEVLYEQPNENLEKSLPEWLPILFNKFIEKSYENPLISGFMKLIDIFLNLSKRINYTIKDEEKFRMFIKTVMQKSKGTSGELQIACLKLIFKTPLPILMSLLEDLKEIFEIGFKLGKNLIWMAESALSCLKGIVHSSEVEIKIICDLLRHVLPLLDVYLQSKSTFNVENFIDPQKNVKINQKKNIKRYLIYNEQLINEESLDLRNFQKRILLFLGTLEPNMCLYLFNSEEKNLNLTKWDVDQNLKLPIQCYDDINPVMYLDNIIPRIFLLAKMSSDRKTKIVACEFIHALILYIIGTKSYKSKRLWFEVCQGMLELGCDPDTAVQQMFEPLIMQIMHHKAKPTEWGSESNEILISVIMDSLSNQSSPAVRDLSARCLRELLIWSIEMANDENALIQTTIKDIVYQINFYCLDYNTHRRLGAALAFNNIYRILREKERILDLYWVMFLYTFNISLRMCDESKNFWETELLVEQIKLCLDHVIRVMMERSDIFQTISEERQKPEQFPEADLTSSIDYVFSNCNSKFPNLRKKSKEMFSKLFSKQYKTIDHYISQRNVALDSFCLDQISIDTSELQLDSTQTVVDHLDDLLISVESIIWFLSELKIDIKTIQPVLENGNLFRNVKEFLNRFLYLDLSTISSEKQVEHEFKFNNLKIALIREIIDLFRILSENEINLEDLQIYDDLVNLIMLIIFPTTRIISEANLTTSIESYLHSIKDNSTLKSFKELFLTQLIERTELETKTITENIATFLHRDSLSDEEKITIKGLKLSKLYIQKLNGVLQGYETSSMIIRTFFHCCNNNGSPFNPKKSVLKYANHMMSFALNGLHNLNLIDEIIEMLLNNDHLKIYDANEGGIVCHGDHFMQLFKEEILKWILNFKTDSDHSPILALINKMNDQNSTIIQKRLIDICKYVYQYHRNDSEMKTYVIEMILSKWDFLFESLQKWDDNYDSSVLKIIDIVVHVALINVSELNDMNQKMIGFDQWIFKIFTNDKISLDLKAKVLTLLPIVTGSKDQENNDLMRALCEFQSRYIPLHSGEFKPQSLERAKFMVNIKNLLESLLISRSKVLFQYIISITISDENHIMEYDIRKSVTELMEQGSPEEQLEFLQFILKLFLDQSMEPILRSTIYKRFIKTMIRASADETIKTFFETNIQQIIDLLDSNYSLIALESNYFAIEQALINRTVAFYFIELMFGKLKQDQMSGIARALDKPDVKNIVSDFSRRCCKTRKEIFLINHEPINELFRKYQCSAYRAICTIVSNTQTDLKFYDKLLFTENTNDFIWSKIVSNKEDIFKADFVLDFDDFPKMKRRVVSIKQNDKALKEQLDSVKSKFETSNNIFTSSLSQDIAKIDFSNAIVSNKDQRETVKRNVILELEKFKLNDHELMPTLCAVIKHMFENGITPVPEHEGQFLKNSPFWVDALAKVINDSSQTNNNRVFLGKVVENCSEIFQYYAPTVFGPILQLIVDECAGRSLNVYYIDLICMLLKWSKNWKPKENSEERNSMSMVLRFLVSNCHHESIDVLKLNLELIKNVVTLWKDMIVVPKQILFDLIIRTRSIDSKENYCGLQLNAIFLVNDLVPWIRDSKTDFLKALLQCLDNEFAVIYQSAAQLLGLFLSKEKDETDLEMVIEKLNIFKGKKNEKKFADILYGVHLNFSSIIESFSEIVVSGLSCGIKAMKIKYLIMFLAQTETFGERIFKEIVALGILEMLKQKDFQLHALHIINKSLNVFSIEDINYLYSHLIPNTRNSDLDCRLLVYEIFIKIFKMVNNLNVEMTVKVKSVLLQGLRDPEEVIANRLLMFWSEEADLGPNLLKRMATLLESSKDENSNADFLEFGSQLLLDIIIKNPNSKHQIFPNEDEFDNKLKEYEININWRSQNISQNVPLFVHSMRKDFVAGDGSLNFKTLTQVSGNLMFEPTQELSKVQSVKTNFSIPTQSFFAFNTNTSQVLDTSSQKVTNPDQSSQDQEFNLLKKRLVKDKDKKNRTIALEMTTKHKFEQQRKLYKRRDRSGKIVLFRRYRFGDFPDLLINYLAILMPLQGLVKCDKLIARQVFVEVFTALLNSLREDKSAYLEFCNSINKEIKGVLNDSKTCPPNVFATFLEIALVETKLFSFPTDLIANIATNNNMSAIAALYLEGQLDHVDDEQEHSKRATHIVSPSHKLWMNLANIYKAVAETEIVSAILTEKMQSDEELTKAIEYENNGNYSKAKVLYFELIKKTNRIERDFCYEGFYNCCMEMGQWKETIILIQNELSDWDNLWTDDWNQENLLPNLMQASLRLILDKEHEGDDSFLRYLERSMLVPDKKNYLITNFSEELVMFHLATKNNLAARVLCEDNINYFVNEWGHLNVLSRKLRQNKLLKIRTLSELNQYLYLMINGTKNDDLELIYDRWDRTSPNKSDSLSMWDFLFSYRRFIGSELQIGSLKVEELIFEMNYKIFNLAISQRNMKFADKMLSKIAVSTENLHNAELFVLKYKLARSKHQALKGRSRNDSKSFDLIMESFNRITKEILPNNVLCLNTELHLMTVDECVDLTCSIFDSFNNMNLSSDQKRLILDAIPGKKGSNISEKLHYFIQTSLKKSVEITNGFPIDSLNQTDLNAIKNSNYKLAQYCFDYLELNKNKIIEEEKTEIQKLMLETLFECMRFESTEGQKLFPSILKFKKNPKLEKTFIEKCQLVPDYLFLKWIPQIMSHFNYSKSNYLDDLVLRISASYPEALYLPFNLSMQQFEFQNPSQSPKAEVKKIKEHLYRPNIKLLIEGLSNLCLPPIMFHAHLNNLSRALKFMNTEEFKTLLRNTIHILFPENKTMQGLEFRTYKDLKKSFEELLQFNVSDLDDLKIVKERLQKLIKDIEKKREEARIRNRNVIPLENLSPWLANFSSINGCIIEIPGQYTDLIRKPDANRNVKIIKFGNKIGVLKSKTCPMRVTIYGSDGKQYDFLLKYSEDLRQDQRIQQVFKLMSENLEFDKNCKNNELKIESYNVNPITNYFGMLSWVKDSVPIRDFIEKSVVFNTNNNSTKLGKVIAEFERFLKVNSESNNMFEMYWETVEKSSPNQLRTKFQELSFNLPQDLLRRCLVEISVSPEAFFALRNNFCKTMSVMNIAHWILGIGDRHLMNILMNTKNCNMIGIDFNLVFESGYRNLPIPELIPFRLTPQFVNVNAPFGVTGLIKSCMTNALRVFRNDEKLILSCLEVFLREPTIDWLYSARMAQDDPAEFDTLSTDTRVHWEPNERIDSVRNKLKGCNPVAPILKGLQEGPLGSKQQYIEAYIEILKGNSKINIRKRLPDKELNAEEQVNCLIDLATDQAVLGITYQGLMPWL